MTDEQRDAIYASIRADRLARGGKPPPHDADRVARSVVWTMYLAGVDVRHLVKTREPVVFHDKLALSTPRATSPPTRSGG